MFHTIAHYSIGLTFCWAQSLTQFNYSKFQLILSKMLWDSLYFVSNKFLTTSLLSDCQGQTIICPGFVISPYDKFGIRPGGYQLLVGLGVYGLFTIPKEGWGLSSPNNWSHSFLFPLVLLAFSWIFARFSKDSMVFQGLCVGRSVNNQARLSRGQSLEEQENCGKEKLWKIRKTWRKFWPLAK